MNEHGLDKIHFGRLLRNEYALATEALNKYERYSRTLSLDETGIEINEETKQKILKSLKSKRESYERAIVRLVNEPYKTFDKKIDAFRGIKDKNSSEAKKLYEKLDTDITEAYSNHILNKIHYNLLKAKISKAEYKKNNPTKDYY